MCHLYRLAVAAIIALTVSSSCLAARYRIEPGGTVRYGSFWSGGCDSQTRECLYQVAGGFEFRLDSQVDEATFANVDLSISGNEEFPSFSDFLTAEYFGSFLEERSLNEISDPKLEGVVYRDPDMRGIVRGPPGWIWPLTVVVNGDKLQVIGGYDIRFIDGDAIGFEFSAIRVPEPASFACLGVASVALLLVRHRKA